MGHLLRWLQEGAGRPKWWALWGEMAQALSGEFAQEQRELHLLKNQLFLHESSPASPPVTRLWC